MLTIRGFGAEVAIDLPDAENSVASAMKTFIRQSGWGYQRKQPWRVLNIRIAWSQTLILQPLSTCLSVINIQQQKYFTALCAAHSSGATLTIYTIFWQWVQMHCPCLQWLIWTSVVLQVLIKQVTGEIFFFYCFCVEEGQTPASVSLCLQPAWANATYMEPKPTVRVCAAKMPSSITKTNII